MEKALLSDYFGVPVLLQLRIPLVIPMISEKHPIPHSDEPEALQWIPQEAIEPGSPADAPQFSSTQLIRYAVLRDVEPSESSVEVVWMVPGTTGVCTVATLINDRDIAAVTRVVSVPDPPTPSLIIQG